jgi:nitric oxide reductase subunit C
LLPKSAKDDRSRRSECSLVSIVTLAALLMVGSGPLLRHPDAATTGNPARGAEVYARLPCGSCHDITKPWPGGDICPNLGNIATEATRIVRLKAYRGKAHDAAGYIRESIVDPNAYIVPGASYRTPEGQSVMPRDFGRTLTAAELDDLVAFLLTKR